MAVTAVERRRFHVTGIVQGVGFRPFVHALARRHGVAGFVLNTGNGVVIEAEGADLDAFAAALVADAPPLARIESLVAETLAPLAERGFEIRASGSAALEARAALVPPDIATCDDCLHELFDPDNRRYRYPFINCTNCGPRFTIVERTPYDRANTTMHAFAMCSDCRCEYEDPHDRRFHAEPIACSACGPRLSMPLEEAIALIRQGAIVAVKGLGGYHLACDAARERTVERLRARKHREEKPFALMASQPDLAAEVSAEEWELLRSPARPIVLLRRSRCPSAPVAAAVAPGTQWLGVMLPYTPLHHLLCHDFGRPLVMTSGNVSDEPIAIDDDDARRRLAGIADAFLTNDRTIHRRCEDSVVRVEFPVRRSRGYVPSALPVPAAPPLVAVGAELKATFCVARDGQAFLSPHLGDLDSAAAFRAFEADLALYLEMLRVRPDVIAHDLHPEYLSTKWAEEQDAALVGVQHHHAHAAACLAEHGEEGPALALVFDGTGYGIDGTLWGGELLRCDLAAFERLVHLDPVPLPGGEAAIREPWRVAAAYLDAGGIEVPWPRWELVSQTYKVNAPASSGMGRLFDAVAALLGLRDEITYEGQAAIELEQLAGDVEAEPYKWRFGRGAELVARCHDDLAAGRNAAEIAAAFHETVARAAAEACAEAAEPRVVVLSGGTFQNLRLLHATRRRLETLGFRVLTHRRVPPNDGGISYGQAAVAARRIRSCA